MECHCIEKLFDIHVEMKGPSILVVQDESKWMNDSKPDSFPVLLRITNQRKEIALNIKTDGRNLFSFKDIFGAEDGCFPDGIYCFLTQSCGIKYEVSRAVTPNIDCRLNETLAASNKDFSEYTTLSATAKAMSFSAELGQPDKASGMLNFLKKSLINKHCDQC